MLRRLGTLWIAAVVASCGSAQVASSAAPAVAATTATAVAATATIAATASSAPVAPTISPAAVVTPTSAPTSAAVPTEAASDGPTPIPLPRPIDSTAKPTPQPTLAPTATPTPVASAAPTTSGARATVYTVHSADNYMHVQYDRAMRQSGAGAANALSAYLLDGAALPAGSTVICGSPSCDVVRIDMPQNLVRGSAHTMTVRGVFSADGAELSPDPTFTAFRTDTQPG